MEKRPLALWKNSNAIVLLQEGTQLVSSLCAFIQSYDVINRMFLLHFRDILPSDWSCNIFAVGTGQVKALDPRAVRLGLALPD